VTGTRWLSRGVGYQAIEALAGTRLGIGRAIDEPREPGSERSRPAHIRTGLESHVQGANHQASRHDPDLPGRPRLAPNRSAWAVGSWSVFAQVKKAWERIRPETHDHGRQSVPLRKFPRLSRQFRAQRRHPSTRRLTRHSPGPILPPPSDCEITPLSPPHCRAH